MAEAGSGRIPRDTCDCAGGVGVFGCMRLLSGSGSGLADYSEYACVSDAAGGDCIECGAVVGSAKAYLEVGAALPSVACLSADCDDSY